MFREIVIKMKTFQKIEHFFKAKLKNSILIQALSQKRLEKNKSSRFLNFGDDFNPRIKVKKC